MRADQVKAGPKFNKYFTRLNKSSDLFKELDGIFDLLKEDCFRGRIRRELWPKCYVQAYRINNLYRLELSGAWRLIYTVYSRKGLTTCNILESLSHTEYDQRFNY